MANRAIRAAGIGDVEVLCQLNAEVHALHVANRPDQFNPARVEELADWFGKLLLDPAARVWLAEVDGLAVGYVTAIARERPENPFCLARKWWELDAIGVRAASRRGGVGRALVEKVVHEAKAAGVRDLELSSWAFNPSAQRLFSSCRFVPKVVRFELRLGELDSAGHVKPG